MPTVTPRQFVAALGVALLLAGAAFILLIPVTSDYESILGSGIATDCGTTVSPTGLYSGEPASACKDAVSTRQAWAWPVLAAGAVVLAAAMFVQSPTRRPVDEEQ